MKKKLQRASLAFLLCVGFVAVTAPVEADLADDLKALEEQRKKAAEEQAGKASEADQAAAEAAEIAERLREVNEQVNQLQVQIDAAEGRIQQAERRQIDDKVERDKLAQQIPILEKEVVEQSVAAFRRQGADSELPFLTEDDPSVMMRMQRLAASVTADEVEATENLRQAKAALEERIDEGDSTRAEYDQTKADREADQQKLQEVYEVHAKFFEEAEAKLNRALSEVEVIKEHNQQLAIEQEKKTKELSRQAALAKRGQSSRSRSGGAPVTLDGVSIKTVISATGAEVKVNTSIADNVQALFDAARRDGLSLSGWGYRDSRRQVQLRIQNCGGSSNYAIYRKPASSCRPPTAVPGASKHEEGLAIDFTLGGSTIKSRRSSGFRWLNANASKYGLKNLPSEAWHWSTNGQ